MAITYKFGGKNGVAQQLVVSEDMVVVRTRSNKSLSRSVSSDRRRIMLAGHEEVAKFEHSNTIVLKQKKNIKNHEKVRDQMRSELKKESEIEFAGRVLCRAGTGEPTIYTENIFLQFLTRVSVANQRSIIAKHNLRIKHRITYTSDAWFLEAPKGIGHKLFDMCNELLETDGVKYCHPELIFPRSNKNINTNQWHLQRTNINGTFINAHINVKNAWKTSRGANTTIAIIDDAIDIDHQDFATPNKIVAPRNIGFKANQAEAFNPRPINNDERHGTACAGVACASGEFGTFGVAPDAKLIPIKLTAGLGLGSQLEAEAITYAVDNGADVISCSWGPLDGEWWNPNDPLHYTLHPIPDNVREALEYAAKKGRNGKGCVITWAAGNGNESLDNDGYASNPNVIAVGASNIYDKRSTYSDFGKQLWCCFPSGDFKKNNNIWVEDVGIWTTDINGYYGYNPIKNPGKPARMLPEDPTGNYTNYFTGTSSACPGIAGIAALILSANPSLTALEVKDIIKRSCTKIDTEHGQYDSEGHSLYYGYGKPDAALAVQLATGSVPDTNDDPESPKEDEFDSFTVLKLGDSGELVKKLQELLNQRGYKLPISSFFEEQTKTAVMDFQAKNLDKLGNPLVVDGKVGALTWWSVQNKDTSNIPILDAVEEMPHTLMKGSPEGRNALQVAIREMLRNAGETGGNNKGEDIEAYFAPLGITQPLPWAAAFVSWCFDKGNQNIPFAYSASASKILAACESKKWTYSLQEKITPRPGDMVFWHRNDASRRVIHIGIVHHVDSGILFTIEGNRGVNAKVRGYNYMLNRMEEVLSFARIGLEIT